MTRPLLTASGDPETRRPAPATETGNADPNTVRTPADVALDEVVARLRRHCAHHGAGQSSEIAAWVQEAAAGFVDAPIQTYVPILVERIVRRRIESSKAAQSH